MLSMPSASLIASCGHAKDISPQKKHKQQLWADQTGLETCWRQSAASKQNGNKRAAARNVMHQLLQQAAQVAAAGPQLLLRRWAQLPRLQQGLRSWTSCPSV